MKASVIIPIFNAKATIKDCLNSLISQDVNFDYEIIAVDDGSTDSTKSVLKSFEKNKKINVIYNENSGPAVARNMGANKAKGKIIVFLDSDCIPKSDWLKEMVKPFENEKVAGVQGAYKTKQKSLMARFVQIEIEDRYNKMLGAKNLDWIGSYSAAYKRETFLELSGFDRGFVEASGEDPDLSYTLSKKGYLLIFNPHAIVYHTHPESLINYLKKKFVHAFWRVRLYKKHTEKAVSDSYTPQTLKLQILAVFFLIFGIIASIIYPEFVQYLILAPIVIFVLAAIPFVIFALSKDISIGFYSIGVIPLRTLFFVAGLVWGAINGIFK